MPRSITDLNVTKLDPAKHAARLGEAHQLIVAGILMRLGFDVGLLSTKGGPYDLLVVAYESPGGEIKILRAQVKTASKGGSIKFIGGTRAGIDRKYIPGVKKYKYTTKDNDLIIGVDRNTLDLYLIPTMYISDWGESRSLMKLQPLKNNWDILLNWNQEFLARLKEKLPR